MTADRAASADSVKWLYVAPRGADISMDDFPRAWRGHARLAGRFPDLAAHFSASIYCLVSGGGRGDFDAAAVLTLPGLDAVEDVLRHPDAVATMHPDERRVFSDLIAHLSLGALEEVVKPGPVGPFARLEFLQRREGASPEAFAAQVREELRSHLATAGEQVSRAVLNHRIPGLFPDSVHRQDAAVELYGAEGTPPAGIDYSASGLVDLERSLSVCGPVIMNWSAARPG